MAKNKLNAPQGVRDRCRDFPVIALYQDEADAIVDGTLADDHDGFMEWAGEWKRFIFKNASIIIKPRKGKDIVHLAYDIGMDRIRVTAFASDSDAYSSFYAYPAAIDFEDMSGFIKPGADHGDVRGCSFIYPSPDVWRPIVQHAIDSEVESFSKRMDVYKEELMGIVKEIEGIKLRNDALQATKIRLKALNDRFDKVSKFADALAESSKNTDDSLAIKTLLDVAKPRTALVALTVLYHFQKRGSKEYRESNPASTEGYRRHNDLYNPLKKLNPPAIVRPLNGTRSWFDQQRARHTESWHVKGHRRVLRAERYGENRGREIWVNPFVKGTGANMRLAVYVEEVGRDIVEGG